MFFPHSKADFQRIFNYYSFTHLRKELYNFLQIVYNEYFVHPKKPFKKTKIYKNYDGYFIFNGDNQLISTI